MKFIGFVFAILSLILFSAGPGSAQADNLPSSGTYFITNVASDEALQPAGPTLGQNVLLYEFKQGGAQKWQVTRKIDPVTKKPTNQYTIQLASETSLNMQPHPIADACVMLGSDTTTLVLEPTDAGTLVKIKNGDALYTVASPPMHAEAHFGPSDGSKKFRWNFISAN